MLQAAGRRYGVLVDSLLGQHQTVIKPLGRMFRSLRGMSGSSILGNGEVALIFDVPALSQLAAAPAQAPRRVANNHHPRRTDIMTQPNISWMARLLAGAELQQAHDAASPRRRRGSRRRERAHRRRSHAGAGAVRGWTRSRPS